VILPCLAITRICDAQRLPTFALGEGGLSTGDWPCNTSIMHPKAVVSHSVADSCDSQIVQSPFSPKVLLLGYLQYRYLLEKESQQNSRYRGLSFASIIRDSLQLRKWLPQFSCSTWRHRARKPPPPLLCWSRFSDGSVEFAVVVNFFPCGGGNRLGVSGIRLFCDARGLLPVSSHPRKRKRSLYVLEVFWFSKVVPFCIVVVHFWRVQFCTINVHT